MYQQEFHKHLKIQKYTEFDHLKKCTRIVDENAEVGTTQESLTVIKHLYPIVQQQYTHRKSIISHYWIIFLTEWKRHLIIYSTTTVKVLFLQQQYMRAVKTACHIILSYFTENEMDTQ